MANIVRAALLQTDWPGTKEAMIEKHEQAAHDAKAEGAQVMCFQELFYGPYFCQVQDTRVLRLHRADSRRPHHAAVRSDSRRRLGMVLVLPMYELEQAGVLQHGRSHRRRRYLPGQVSARQHIPQTKGFWEKYYFTPGNGGYPMFDTAVGKVGVYICYDRHFPEGWRALGLNGAEIVFNPSATSRGLSEYLWRLEQPASAVANIYYVGAINRVGIEAARRQRLLRSELLRRPGRQVRRRRRRRVQPRADRARPRSRHDQRCAIVGRSTVIAGPTRTTNWFAVEPWPRHSSRTVRSCRPPASSRKTC